MLYLSGAVSDKFIHPSVGFMFSPRMGNRVPPARLWAADNGCFPAGRFEYDAWRTWLERELGEHGDNCLFIVVPDMPFDADATIARWQQWRAKAANLGRPLAFVTQDGMGTEDVPWNETDAIFIGGSTVWKTGQESAAIASAAKARGQWLHMGRVNSLKRLRAALTMGCDSVDGTFLKYGPDTNWPRLVKMLTRIEMQPALPLPTGDAA